MADVTELRGHAEQAATHLEALADGLHDAGADDAAVQAVKQMASSCNDIAGQLSGGPEGEEAPPEEKPATMDSATNAMQSEMKARRGGK